MAFKQSILFFSMVTLAIWVMVSAKSSMNSEGETKANRQVTASGPFITSALNSLPGGIGGLIQTFLPIIFVIALGALFLPLIGMILFGGENGGLGGILGDIFGRSVSNDMFGNHPLFTPENMIQLVRTVTKAIEKANKNF